MKYKKLTLAALAVSIGLSIFNFATPALAVKCPPGSERNKDGKTDVEVSDITSIAQCSIPTNNDNRPLFYKELKLPKPNVVSILAYITASRNPIFQ